MTQDEILYIYCENNCQKTKSIVDKILKKYSAICGYTQIYQKDMDDFYSIGNSVLFDVSKRFDYHSNLDFRGLLYKSIEYKILSEFTARNREKREGDKYSISLSTPLNDEGDGILEDLVPDRFNLEENVVGSDFEDSKIYKYLRRLTKVQQKIVILIYRGYKPFEIQAILHIDPKKYAEDMSNIKSYDNISILF